MDNKANLTIIVKLLKEHGLHHVVISPGGTNQTFVKLIQDDPFFTCYSVVDERSAIYFAIGLFLQLKTPIVTSCTSAQATRNYIPGLTEAFYKRIPILAITMAKHPRFTYQEYMQAPDQPSLPKDSVKKSFTLPCVSDSNDFLYSARQVNEAILELTRDENGPVQLCVPWLDFPLKEDTREIKKIERVSSPKTYESKLQGKKVLLCIGEHLPFDDNTKSSIESFCERYDAVVYANHISNFHGKYSIGENLGLLTIDFQKFISELKPDVLITIGGQTGDYPFFNLFSRNDIKGMEHWSVNKNGDIRDTYDKLTCVFEMNERDFFDFFSRGNELCKNHKFFEYWKRYSLSIKNEISVPFSAVSIARDLAPKLPENSVIQFSILNSLRVWNFFPLNPTIECFSNVGAFGIDGGMSTLIGQSVASEKMSFLVIGDLAFLYDINSLSIRGIKNNLRILLVNNSGGVEFKLWGGNNEMIDKFIAAGDSFPNAKGWAETCGFTYLSAKNFDEFRNCADIFVKPSVKPLILEAFVTDESEAEAYRALVEGNSHMSFSERAKKAIKRIVK